MNDLNPVTYQRIGAKEKSTEMGFLAQEVAVVLEAHGLADSGLVHQSSPESMMTMRYNDLLAPMIKAIQELDAENRQKDAHIAAVEQRLSDQQAELLAVVKAQQAQMQAQQSQMEAQSEQIARMEVMLVNDTLVSR